jgi:protease-4
MEQFFDAEESLKGAQPPGEPPRMARPVYPPYPQKAPRKRSGLGRGVFTAFAVLILLGSLFINAIFFFWLFVHGMAPSGAGMFNEVYVSGDRSARDVIALVDVSGLLMGDQVFERSLVAQVEKQLDMAGDDSRVKTVILGVDSPGGSMTAIDVLHKNIIDLKQKKKKKLVVLIRGMAASGGYYISAPADVIVSYPTAVVGNIGVIWPHYNYAGLFEKIGLRYEAIKSGDKKDMGSGAREMTPEEREIINDIIMEMHGRFVDVVMQGRRLSPTKARELADGRIFSANQALREKLIDKIGYLEDAEAEARKLAGLTQYKVITYRRERGLIESFLGNYKGDIPGSLGLDELLPRNGVLFMCLWRPGY